VINPTIAFDINEFLSVGLGIDYLWGDVQYDKTPVLAGRPVQDESRRVGRRMGYNFGILVKATGT